MTQRADTQDTTEPEHNTLHSVRSVLCIQLKPISSQVFVQYEIHSPRARRSCRALAAEGGSSVSTVQHRSLAQTVTDALRDMILRGELQSGERLVEDRIAERLSVSRNPVREAIRVLESTGLVQIVPRHGAHVAMMDAGAAERMQEIRRVLEAWIVAAAAERHDANDLADVDECLIAGQRASMAQDNVAESAAHRAFHIALEAATKNEFASVAMEPLRHRTELVFSTVGGSMRDGEGGGSQHWLEHQAIRDAIAARDSARARELIDAHIDAAIRRYGEQPNLVE